MKLLLLVRRFHVLRLLSGGLGDQLDLAAQIIDASNQAQDDLLAVTASEVAGAEFAGCGSKAWSCGRPQYLYLTETPYVTGSPASRAMESTSSVVFVQ